MDAVIMRGDLLNVWGIGGSFCYRISIKVVDERLVKCSIFI